MQRAEGILDRLAVGTRTIGGVDRHDIGTGSNAGASVTQRRRDVNALVPILPQADNGDLTATLNGGNVGKALAANGGGAAELASTRHLSHGLGRTKRLAHIRLNAHDELALQGLDQRINGHVRLNLSQKQPSETPHLDVQTVARVPKYASLLFHVNLRHLRRRTW